MNLILNAALLTYLTSICSISMLQQLEQTNQAIWRYH